MYSTIPTADSKDFAKVKTNIYCFISAMKHQKILIVKYTIHLNGFN